MKFGFKKQCLMRHDWFAWHPVRLDDGRWCWLEMVKRVGVERFNAFTGDQWVEWEYAEGE